MHPEIEKLIDFALADGEVTEKERAIILRKAESLSIDKDEVEMILEAKVHKLESSKKFNHSEKIENIKKCPSCGNTISGLSKTCICGYVINSGDLKNSKSLEEAIETLENLIVEIRSLKENPNKFLEERISAKIEKEIRYINVRYNDNLIVKKLIIELEELSNNTIFTIKKKRQRKKIITRLLITIIISIIGFITFKIVSYKTPEEKFKITVNEIYKDEIIEYNKTKDYKKDSIFFYSLYNGILKNTLTNKQKSEQLDKQWDKLNIKPPSAFKYYFLARKFRRNGDINNSKKYSDTCIALYPKFAPIYFNLSSFDNDKFDIKLEYLNKAIELDKNKTNYLFSRSLIFYENNDFYKAYEDIRKFNEKNRNNFDSNLFEISILLDLNMKENACNQYFILKKKFSNEIGFAKKNEYSTTISMIEKKCK